MADVLVKPHPCLGIDRLPDGAEQAQGGEVVLPHVLIPPLHEGTDRRRGRVEDGDAVLGDQLPEAVGLGPVGRPLVHEAGGAVGQGAVNEVAVTGDPADVGGAPVDILLPEVEDILGGGVCADKVSAGGVENPFGFSGRPAGVEDEERMLAFERVGMTIRRDILEFAVPPDVAARLDMDLEVGAAEDDDALNGVVSLEGMVDVLLEGDDLAAAVASVRGDHYLGTAVG